MEKSDMLLRDKLAVERTKLANERTFLAYFRTSVIFLGTGISIIHIHFFEQVAYVGWGFVMLSPLLFLIGLYRLISVRKAIRKKSYWSEDNE